MAPAHLLAFALCLFASSLLVAGDEACVTKDNDFCSCSTGNLTLNLKQVGLPLPQAHTVADSKYNIYYMPCEPAVCPGATGEKSVICQVQIDKTNVVFSLGRTTNFKWLVTQYHPLEFEIHYEGGDTSKNIDRKSVVHFKAGTGSTVFSYQNEDEDTLTYNFNVVGSKVAPAKRGGGGSSDISGPVGLAIIFLALAGLVAYFVIGGLFMYAKRGARGIEVIPNLAFWKDLPFLIKDGCLFLISPIYKRDKYQEL